ncbi:riboflavin kinase [Ammoniphilus sp. YIM 78166]|uniref:riboflavin kinase n=1 Tax=Ammoniphilus sp. YIM 78166 TaxID=1644106 RepID=UPI00106F3828|nr:riboflavin kinase [Ammoniphilus sp. YIM 78166]
MNRQVTSKVLQGLVVHGEKLGRKIGFPTANLSPIDPFESFPKGVYAVQVRRMERQYQGVMNIGTRPTVAQDELTVEVHILDFNTEIYGETLQIEIIQFIRHEQKFSGLPALKQQIQKDVSKARECTHL